MNYRFFEICLKKLSLFYWTNDFTEWSKWIFLYDLQKKIEIGLLEMFNEQIEKKLNVHISTYN